MRERRKTTKDNETLGPCLTDQSRLDPLFYNGLNRNLRSKRLGCEEWQRIFRNDLRKLGIPEIEPILGTTEDPKVPKWMDPYWCAPRRRKTSNSISSNEDDSAWSQLPYRPSVKHLPKRMQNAIFQLEKMEPANLYFCTVITTIALTIEEARSAIVKDVQAVATHLRRRLPGVKFVITAEFDVKQAKDIDPHLLSDRSWTKKVQPETGCYKVHIHGVLYAEGTNARSIADKFKFTESGKLSRKYSGLNQVRIVQVGSKVQGSELIPEVRECMRYSRKTHYRPPIMDRMLERAPEWVVLTDYLWSNPKACRICGFSEKKAVKSGPVFTPYVKPQPELAMSLRMNLHADRYQKDQLRKFGGVSDHVCPVAMLEVSDRSISCITESVVDINSVSASNSSSWRNRGALIFSRFQEKTHKVIRLLTRFRCRIQPKVVRLWRWAAARSITKT